MDEIWDTNGSQLVDVSKLAQGKRFVLSLKEDLKRMNHLLHQEKLHKDKNNFISGEDLFPVTVVLWNLKDKLPGDKVKLKTSNIELLRLYYFGISPEFENFVTLVLWPEESEHSRRVFKKLMEIYGSSKQPAIYLEGDYRVRLPNELHPFNFSVIKSDLDCKAFDWKYVPWLKEIGDTIFYHRSPANYRKVYLDKKRIKHAYINARIGIGIIKNLLKSTGEIKLKLPYINWDVPKKYLLAKTLSDEQLNDFELGDIVYFVLLEVVHNDSKFIPERYIYSIERADFVDILAHLSAFVLYNKYLEKYKYGLYVMNVPEFQKKIYWYILKVALRYCKNCETQSLIDWELLFEAYLEPFFRIIKQRIYYVPQYLLNSKYLEKKFDINYDIDSLLEIVDILLLETRESRANFSFQKINLRKIMDDLSIDNVHELRALLEITAKVAFIKNLKRLLQGPIWRGEI